jgi:hypothetical protein
VSFSYLRNTPKIQNKEWFLPAKNQQLITHSGQRFENFYPLFQAKIYKIQ